jgi:hypothetical protein
MHIDEIEKIDIEKKSMFTAKEIDEKWLAYREVTSRFQSKLFPNFVISIAESGSGSKNIFLSHKTRINRPLVFMMMSASGFGWETNLTTVRDSAAGQGLGLAVYIILIRELNFILISDSSQSKGGQQIWSRLFKTSGITVYGWDPKAKKGEQFFPVEDFGDGVLDGADRSVYHNPWDDGGLDRTDQRDSYQAIPRKLVAVKQTRG